MEFARLKSRSAPAAVPSARALLARFARPGLGVLLAALAVELADELFDGAKSAAMPLIRHDLSLTYVQVGLLVAVPLIAGSILELPVGVISGTGSRRRRFVLLGGLVFVASVLAAGLAGSFAVLLIALTIFFPASGTFVSLTQAALMDSAPARRAQHMARWTLAGSVGAVAGGLLVAAVVGAGGTWRLAVMLVAGCSAAAWFAVAWTGRAKRPAAPAGVPEVDTSAVHADDGADESGWPGWTSAASIVRRSGALRWIVLLEVSDLLLDVLTAFLALYLVVAVHASPFMAALAVAVRLGAGLAGDLILIRVLARRGSRQVLRASVWLSVPLFPVFLLVPGLGLKLAALAALTIATAPWYPVLTAELFGSLPGHSGLAVSLSSASGLAGGLGPLAVGLLAESFGLSWAMASLCIVPVLMLAVLAVTWPGAGGGGR
jgi:FSR family fosmidomycin resistance protein-like MFS transporter